MLKLYLKSLTNFRFKTRASKHEFGNFFSVWLFVTVLLIGFLSLFCAFNFKSFADFVNSFFLTPEATVSMPMMGKISSLNASCAAAVLLYEVRRQRDLAAGRAAEKA